MKLLNCPKTKVMLIGIVAAIVLGGGGRAYADFTFGEPINVGPPINTEATDGCPVFTADGLSMFIESDRGGVMHVWVATREALNATWQEPVNLTAALRAEGGFAPNISPDGLTLYFSSWGSGSLSESDDLYVTTRASINDPWETPVNLGPHVNSPGFEDGSQILADGLIVGFRYMDDNKADNIRSMDGGRESRGEYQYFRMGIRASRFPRRLCYVIRLQPS
jgi:hypothetical protein